MAIIFYDIPSILPSKAWSFNTWKIRYALNYKSIPYTTRWLEYPQIEPFSLKHGIKASSKKPDGTDQYTLPAIHDPSTCTFLTESILIAEYLDETYPDTPPLFPNGTKGLQVAFADAFLGMVRGSMAFVLHASSLNLSTESRDWFNKARTAECGGVTPEELVPRGEKAVEMWAKFEMNLGKIDARYAKTDEEGLYLMGKEASWADIVVVAYLMWIKLAWGEEDEKWLDVVSWHGGRWGRLMGVMDKYAAIV